MFYRPSQHRFQPGARRDSYGQAELNDRYCRSLEARSGPRQKHQAARKTAWQSFKNLMRHFGDAIDWFKDARMVASQRILELKQVNFNSEGQRDEIKGLTKARDMIEQAQSDFEFMKGDAATMRSMLNERASLLRHRFWSSCKEFGKKLEGIYQSFDCINYIQIKFESVAVSSVKSNRLTMTTLVLCAGASVLSPILETRAKLQSALDSYRPSILQSESTLSRGSPPGSLRYGGDGGPPPDFDHEANAKAISGLVKGLTKLLNSLFTKASVKRLIEVDRRISVEGKEFAIQITRKGKRL